MDETYRKYHAGKYPSATNAATGEEAPPPPSTEVEIDTSATKALRKLLGVTEDGERGEVGGMRTKKALEDAGVQ